MATTIVDLPVMPRRPLVTDRYRGLPAEVRTKIWRYAASAPVVSGLTEDGRNLQMTHWLLQAIIQADGNLAEEVKPFLGLSTAYDFSRLTWPQFVRAFADLPNGIRQEVSEFTISLRGLVRSWHSSTDGNNEILGTVPWWLQRGARSPTTGYRCPSLQHVIFVFDIQACRERQKELEIRYNTPWLLDRLEAVGDAVRQSLALHWHGREIPALVTMIRQSWTNKVTFRFPGATYNQMIELSQKDSLGFRVIPQHAPYKSKGIVRWSQEWHYHPRRLRESNLGIVRLAHEPVDINDEVCVLTEDIKAILSNISPEAADTLGIFEGSLSVCKA